MKNVGSTSTRKPVAHLLSCVCRARQTGIDHTPRTRARAPNNGNAHTSLYLEVWATRTRQKCGSAALGETSRVAVFPLIGKPKVGCALRLRTLAPVAVALRWPNSSVEHPVALRQRHLGPPWSTRSGVLSQVVRCQRCNRYERLEAAMH
eukprot:scaffold102675_cov57-Phaeocystis_antarctica.AAC.5